MFSVRPCGVCGTKTRATSERNSSCFCYGIPPGSQTRRKIWDAAGY